MTKFCLVVFFLLPYFLCGQRQLEPSVHLKPFKELDNATVTALAEDDLGQVWIGTQRGIRFWDGHKLRLVDSIHSTVTHLYQKGGYIYGVLLNSVVKIDCQTLTVESVNFSDSDYRNCNFRESGIFAISIDHKDTVFFDYDLVQKPFKDSMLSLEEVAHLGQYKIVIDHHPRFGFMVEKDSLPISNTFVNHLIQYDSETVFVATHEGLVELRLNDEKKVEKQVHLKAFRVEQLLLDRHQNLWVGTAENGLFMFHHNMIRNNYYPQYIDEKEYNPCWTFTKIGGQLYSCTTNGMIAFKNKTDQLTKLEEATQGKFCFTALETPETIFVGSAREGLYVFRNDILERVYYNHSNALDNTIVQILPYGNDVIFCTKAGIHRIDAKGQIVLSNFYAEANNHAYVMQIYPYGDLFLAANTSGVCIYDQSLNLIEKYQSSAARVFADLAVFQDKWWCASMDGGIFLFDTDTLLPVSSPERQLLMASSFKNDLWFTGLSGAMQYKNDQFIPLKLENGFPLSEYAQGGLFNDSDSLLYFAGVQGIFEYTSNTDAGNTDVMLPQWHLQCNDQFLPISSQFGLTYDQSIISLLPRAIMTSDQNWFALDYFDKNSWHPLENGLPLLIEIPYGKTEIKFRVRHKYTMEENIASYFVYRDTPIWIRTWFRVLMVFVGLIILTGIYFLWKYFRTKKMLKIEAEERKVTQERLRISRELHDNIGARLSHIISSLDIQLFKENGEGEIATINAFAKETMRQLRETIWAVSDKTIFFSELKQRVEHYTVQTDTISPVSIQFTDQALVDFELNATETINLFRIVQEAVNNAIKYSGAQYITVKFHDFEDTVYLTIKDNGSGFLVNEGQQLGTGLKGMVKRSEEIHAELEINSKLGEGTTIKLLFSMK